MGRVNEDVRDDLIEHDIRVRRVVGSEQRKVALRIKQLERDILAAFLSNPPKTERGILRFTKRIQKMAREVFRAQDVAFRDSMKQLAQAENDAVNGAVEQRINGIRD